MDRLICFNIEKEFKDHDSKIIDVVQRIKEWAEKQSKSKFITPEGLEYFNNVIKQCDKFTEEVK